MRCALKQTRILPTTATLIVAVLAGSLKAATSSGIVKGEIGIADQIVVTLVADGHPIRLLVDSGSSSSILDHRVVERLGFGVEPYKADAKVNEMTGLGGSVQAIGRTRVRELVVGNMKIPDVRFEVLDLAVLFEDLDRDWMPIPDGFLGADFLRKFGVTLDFARATVVVHRPRLREVTIRGRVLCVGEDQQPTLTLASEIRDESSYTPVPSAVVTVRGESLTETAATTDATGSFEFRSLVFVKTELLFAGVDHQETAGLSSIPVFPVLISKQQNYWVFLLPFTTCPKSSKSR